MNKILRVLIAEDNPLDAELIVRELRRSGFEPEWQRVDTEAAFLSNIANGWEIILSDYQMPQFGGPRALELLKASNLDIPFIIISGTIGEDEAVAAIKHCAADYLLKDRLARLGLAVTQAIDQARLRRERNATEAALRDSEKQLKLLTNNIPGLISYIDRDLRYRFVNDAYVKMFNRPREEILTMSLRELVGDEAFKRVEPFAKRALANECINYENHVIQPSGETFHFIVTYVPDVSIDGSVKGLYTLVTDVTRLKQAQEALKKSQDQLHQSQKMEAIGQLAGGMAHDFNNQLSVILGYAEILLQKIDDAKLKRFAHSICTAAERSADLTRKLLVFSRKGQQQTVPVDMHAIITETVEMLERTIDKRIHLHLELNAGLAVVTGNASQLQNAMLNLGVNARDAMPDGGSLTYQTDSVSLDSDFCSKQHNEIAPGQYVKISVSDSGTGMSDEVKKHLFEPFFTTKPVGKGTGLGLASVYGTMTQHAGALTVESTLGSGTNFSIYLPLADQGEQVTLVRSVIPQTVKPVRILAVEDEGILRCMLVYVLEDMGHKVLEAEDGKAAVEVYRAHWQEIDLVILDMVMPEMNGHDAFLEMKKINPEIKALLATGYSLNSAVQSILDDGVSGFLQKPFHPEQLQNAIIKVMSL